MNYNILYIDSSEIYGGGQISLLELLKGIDRTRFSPLVLLSHTGRFKGEIEKIGVPYEIIPMPSIRPSSFLTFHSSVWKLGEIIRRDQISLIHTNTSRATIYVMVATRKMEIPVIWHVRIPHRDRLLDRFLGPRCSQIIAVSQAVKNRFNWLKKVKVKVIYNGVDTERFSLGPTQDDVRKKFNLDNEDIVIGTVGRLSPEKGFEFLISAMEDMTKVYPQTRVLIAGNGNEEYRLSLHAKVNGLRLSSNIIFIGFCKDIPEILRCVDIFCLPSLTEGFNRTILEAMACGLPVVATSVGGNIEIVQDRVNGLLVPSGNSERLAAAITELVNDREKARTMGLEGRRLVEKNFSIEKNVKRIEKLYLQILE